MKLLLARKARMQYQGQPANAMPPMTGMHEGEVTIPLLGGDGMDAIRVTIVECVVAFEIEETR